MKTWRLIFPSEKLRFQSPSHPLSLSHTHCLRGVPFFAVKSPKDSPGPRRYEVLPPRCGWKYNNNNNNNRLLNIHKRRKRATMIFLVLLLLARRRSVTRVIISIFFPWRQTPSTKKNVFLSPNQRSAGDRARETPCKSRRRLNKTK